MDFCVALSCVAADAAADDDDFVGLNRSNFDLLPILVMRIKFANLIPRNVYEPFRPMMP